MAKPSSPQLPQHFKIDVGDDVALKIGERAAGRIVRGAHLTEQLEIGRALVVLQRIADGMGGRGGSNYPVAMNAQLEAYPKLAAISPQLRAAAIWCIRNWNDGVKAYLDGSITEHQRQTMGVRGLQSAVQAQRSEAWRNAERPPRERPYNYPEGAWRAMQKMGLAFDRNTESFVPGADEEALFGWIEHHFGPKIAQWREETAPTPEPSSESPPSSAPSSDSPEPSPEPSPPAAPSPAPRDRRYRRPVYPPPRPAPRPDGDAGGDNDGDNSGGENEEPL
jgi:hypothetical protein